MKEHYPRQPIDRERWGNELDTGNRPPYRDVELRAALADWHLHRPPLMAEVAFRLRRGREGLAVKTEIQAMADRLREAQGRAAARQARHDGDALQPRLVTAADTVAV